MMETERERERERETETETDRDRQRERAIKRLDTPKRSREREPEVVYWIHRPPLSLPMPVLSLMARESQVQG